MACRIKNHEIVSDVHEAQNGVVPNRLIRFGMPIDDVKLLCRTFRVRWIDGKYTLSNVLANNDDTPVSCSRTRGIAVKDERFQKKKDREKQMGIRQSKHSRLVVYCFRCGRSFPGVVLTIQR